MKTQNINKRRTWRLEANNLEVWYCVETKDVAKSNPKILGKVFEMELGPKEMTPLGGKLVYVWQVGNRKGIEWRNREAMQKAEDAIDGIKLL